MSSAMLGVARKILGQGRQDARTGLEQNDARAARIDSAKILGQGLAGNLGDGPGHFDAGRSSTDDDEGQQTLPLGIIIAGKLGLLECQQNASANAGRIFNTLEPGSRRIARPGRQP
jgi:hypothetical protein